MHRAQNGIAAHGASGKRFGRERMSKSGLIEYLLALPAADLRLIVIMGCLGFWGAVFTFWLS